MHVGLEVGLGLGGAGDVDWAGQHLVAFLLKDIVDLAMLACNVN